MNSKMANIPIAKYQELAGQFAPDKFDARAIAQLAKVAGMKYIVITAKHHDGFAMYQSKVSKFNIVDATPTRRNPMKELAEACHKVAIGLGFYYSHNQDWTFPGGNNGPTTDADGKPATFDDYFVKNCLPQVEEITSQYGPIEIVWFDTPGRMPRHYVEQLVAVVRKNQPHALVSGRAGHDLGDYQTFGDMQIPVQNQDGLWESVDTSNDSWAYAWYDENGKTPGQILQRLISCGPRGGTYMLNTGPRGDGSVPGGDVTARENKLFFSVFNWPAEGELCLRGLNTEITSARLLRGDKSETISHKQKQGWTCPALPPRAPDPLASVIEVTLAGKPEVDTTLGINPVITTELNCHLPTVQDATKNGRRWMEKCLEGNLAMASLRTIHFTPVPRYPGDASVFVDLESQTAKMDWK